MEAGVILAVYFVVLLAGGTVIASIPGITVTHLFLVYGTLRSTTMLPTILTLAGHRFNQKGMCYGILLAICVGLPVFAAGTFLGADEYKTIGCLTATLTGVAVAALWGPKND